MLVYPAVDIAAGKCVRLLQGRPDEMTVYYERPAEAALHWQRLGAQALHVVDLDAALGRAPGGQGNVGAVQEILDAVRLPVQVAGGLRSETAVERALNAGAARAVVGTRAVRDPDWAVALCRRWPDRIVIALDAREGRVAVEGWQELVEAGPVELARRLEEARPAALLYTDVARDGMLSRPNFQATGELLRAVRTPVIASGGVASLEDVRRLGECGADAVVIGKALYEGRVALPEAIEVASGYPSRLSPEPTRGAGRPEGRPGL
jgi:phosphoribosylformimino-5-aminoimidazole carboxamide ribotide isomerase